MRVPHHYSAVSRQYVKQHSVRMNSKSFWWPQQCTTVCKRTFDWNFLKREINWDLGENVNKTSSNRFKSIWKFLFTFFSTVVKFKWRIGFMFSEYRFPVATSDKYMTSFFEISISLNEGDLPGPISLSLENLTRN